MYIYLSYRNISILIFIFKFDTQVYILIWATSLNQLVPSFPFLHFILMFVQQLFLGA